MRLNALRDVAFPGVRAFHATFVSMLVMASVILGLLAMHAIDAEQMPSTPAAAGSVQGAHTENSVAFESTGMQLPATAEAVAVTAVAAECGESCVHDAPSCMLLAIACTMLVAMAVAVFLARRPATYRRLLDTSGRVVAIAQDISSRFHRPDLYALSISRT